MTDAALSPHARRIRLFATVAMTIGVLFVLAGIGAWIAVSTQLAAENITVSEDAAVLAETIRMDLSVRPATTESGAVPATVSIGVAAVPVEHASLDRLISQADKALYAAKVDGRDRTAIRHGDDSIIVPCASRIPDPVTMDKSADRQVAALNRMAKIARS